jgi:aminoglycoside phosphotransferase family enzyme
MKIQVLIQGLQDPQAFPGEEGKVEVLQTHISVLFFVGDRVYKVKKPVDLGFLDYRSLEARRFFCEEEVRLGKDLAASVYLGVWEIRREGKRFSVGGGQGELVDYCVAMRRLPEDRMMNRLVCEKKLKAEQLSSLVDLLVRFHREAATGGKVDSFGAPELVLENCEENFEQCRDLLRDDPEKLRHLEAMETLRSWTLDRFDSLRALFQERVRKGRIREGHGDLHAGNICFLTEGVVIYDRIEFSMRFRCLDVASELAFLGMDLDHLGARDLSRRTMRAYAERSGDEKLPQLLPFYKVYRAMVRAKVALFRAHEAEVPKRERRSSQAEFLRYLGLGLGYRAGKALILLCGLPGSGKTEVAHQLVDLAGAQVFHSDQIRKEQAGLTPTQSAKAPFGEGIYGEAQSRACYAGLLEACRQALRKDGIVVADAGFPSRERRAPFVDLARASDVSLICVYLAPNMSTLVQRVRKREANGPGLSDAGLLILQNRAKTFAPPQTSEIPRLLVIGDHFASLPPVETGVEILRQDFF